MWHCSCPGADSDTGRSSNLSYPWSLKPLIAGKCEANITLPAPRGEGDIMHSRYLKSFTLDELKSATGNFCPESLIGEGGFGFVHKGCVNGGPGIELSVAVKKLKTGGLQGHKEWLVSFLLNYFIMISPCDCTLLKSVHVCMIFSKEGSELSWKIASSESSETDWILLGKRTPPFGLRAYA